MKKQIKPSAPCRYFFHDKALMTMLIVFGIATIVAGIPFGIFYLIYSVNWNFIYRIDFDFIYFITILVIGTLPFVYLSRAIGKKGNSSK